MPRVSDTDQRLVDTALEMVKHSSLSGLKLRDVAKKAGVNLGMFHYHFKTKDQFTRAVLQDTYEKFFSEFTLETTGDGPAIERLRSALITLGKFISVNRRMLLGILHDVLNKNRVVLDFVKSNAPRHGLVILGLVRECQKEGSLRKMPLPSLMPVLMGSCFFPYVMVAMLEHLEVKRLSFIPLVLIKQSIISNKALSDRVDLVLESLAPRKGRKK
ncbi:MAG TPA: TetR/AcrR family transcriptional regulator [bacterium]|jgi:AcrR family transcriptional regulator|nr:TetR/AcrR family transcriptional regulator [bacterium]